MKSKQCPSPFPRVEVWHREETLLKWNDTGKVDASYEILMFHTAEPAACSGVRLFSFVSHPSTFHPEASSPGAMHRRRPSVPTHGVVPSLMCDSALSFTKRSAELRSARPCPRPTHPLIPGKSSSSP